MNTLKKIATIAVMLSGIAGMAFGQAETPPTVKGTLNIAFNTRTQLDESDKPQEGVMDVYKLDLNFSNAALIAGEITHLPTLFSSVLGRETQAARLTYALNLSVVNPKNPAQSKRVGRMVGTVPIDKKGVYRFNDGTLSIGVDAIGTAVGFDSKFRGLAAGRPPKSDSMLDRAKSETMSITRTVKGQKRTIIVKDYDRMVLTDLIVAAGPVRAYPETRFSGEVIYDYERSAWYFRNVTMSYEIDGKSVTDKLSGNIRWVESPQRQTNGEGEYQFDVRVNEPDPNSTEEAVFTAADDESAFFESDPQLASLTGSAKYKDIGTDPVTSSTVTVDLVGNNLSRQQVMALTKLIWLVNVVPMNSE